ncbi:hypothetical protein FACS1894190_14600 [Spirochaetia bacterium]|nr:hypothetical protein FACS1894190_14600 [Spirochaetia bacterium]
MICDECNKEIPEDFLICPECWPQEKLPVSDPEQAQEQAPTKNDQLNKYFLDRADMFFAQHDYQKSIECLSKVIQLGFPYRAAYILRGFVHHYFDNNIKAIKDYTSCIYYFPNKATPYLLRGDSYREQGYYDMAIWNYTEAIKLGKKWEDSCFNCYDAYFGRGIAYFNKWMLKKAIADFTKATHHPSKKTLAFHWRGRCYFTVADICRDKNMYIDEIKFCANDYHDDESYISLLLDKALRDLLRAYKIKSYDGSFYFDRALIYYGQGKCELAITVLPKRNLPFLTVAY